jgi:acetolactate synthase-1/2/3 large subunit
VYLAVPEDIESVAAPADARPLQINMPRPDEPSVSQVARAAAILGEATNPIVLAGHGAARADAGPALIRFAERLGVSVATTFHGKGVFPDDHPQALGAIGFMRHDYVNFGFDQADVIVTVGYELQEFDPVRINPRGDKQIIHIHRFPAEVDLHYNVSVGLQADIGRSLDALAAALDCHFENQTTKLEIRRLLAHEFAQGSTDERFPMAPARIVADIRAAMGRNDIVLVDTGALKMWMARLYPTYAPNTCLISNGLSTMAWSLPGAIGANIARPDAKILVATGDGGFLMNSQEIETALREGIPMVILIWVDNGYGLISWKMNLELGHEVETKFGNPDFVAYAQSFGAAGYEISSPDELLPTLRAALAEDTVSVVACPVDYSANSELIRSLGALDESLS